MIDLWSPGTRPYGGEKRQKTRAETPKQNKSASEAVDWGEGKGSATLSIDYRSALLRSPIFFSFSVSAKQATEKISLVEKKKNNSSKKMKT